MYLRSTRFTPGDILNPNDALTSPCVDTVEEYLSLHFPNAREVRSATWPQEARYFRVKDVYENDYIRAVWFA